MRKFVQGLRWLSFANCERAVRSETQISLGQGLVHQLVIKEKLNASLIARHYLTVSFKIK